MANHFIANLKEAIKQDPTIELLHFQTFKGLDIDEIDDLCKYNVRRLTKDLISFYQASNGLQVCWISKENSSYEQLKLDWKYTEDWWKWKKEYYYYDGIIQILPLSELFGQAAKFKWWFENEVDFSVEFLGRKTNSLSVKKRSLLFDVYDIFYSSALYWPTKTAQPIVLFLEDHEADFFSSSPVTSSEYFSMLLETKGSIAARIRK
ncbi:hypothetical protein SAMN05421636_102370 [Pricia antarctica]|uniref:Uncharacterized protein n=1 Tax=Pricia antarctica TaxID=641691 RepID=A0A1G6YVP0_9FLAO|nr:hypothetical protein [Pricia antarctica]SDD93697.1 hypothetical protein SAMN05421636_102370 [Pricia antarctica]